MPTKSSARSEATFAMSLWMTASDHAFCWAITWAFASSSMRAIALPPIRRRQTANISVLFMVVMIDLENLAAYEKYRKKLGGRCRGKRDCGIRDQIGLHPGRV